MRTAVVVLGDLGRSPRMQYHALSLAAMDGQVDLVGLEGAPLHASLTAEPRIRSHRLSDQRFGSRTARGRRRYVWLSAARATLQAARLLSMLLRLPRPDVLLVQNPPAVPTLAIAWAASRLRRSRLIIDWHNLSHTILAVTLGEQHRVVRSLARSERRWARHADGHLAVSRAMADRLRRDWGIDAVVLYDRPPAFFTKPSLDAASAMWHRLARELTLGSRRLPLVVCPTSWTPDEDFDLLLEALERAERALAAGRGSSAAGPPALVVLMTGRGALRQGFEQRLARRAFRCIAVRTVWLDPANYPVVVGMAEVGLCLHQSSSGLDLPMKLADFRGTGVPACAYDYAPVLSEALTPGHEGLTFRDPGELSVVFTALARGDLSEVPDLVAARSWLASHPAERWAEQWHRVATSLVTR